MRELSAWITFPTPNWNTDRQEAIGPSVLIRFNGPAAPLKQVGKVVPPGLIKISPDVQGQWKWVDAKGIEFFPAGGWLPPGGYHFEIAPEGLATDCRIKDASDFGRLRRSPRLQANFRQRDYYVDPRTPDLQQLTTTVTFSQPVSLEQIREKFSVTSVTGIEIFQPGSQAQILADPKDPMRFYLRSPLMEPGDKEDLILFRFEEGISALSGGTPTTKPAETKLTAYSKDSMFFVETVASMLRKTREGEPEQNVLVELSVPTDPQSVAAKVEAWKLPKERRDGRGRLIQWTKENVSDELLAESEKLRLQLVTNPDAPAWSSVLAFRVPQQPGGKVFIKMPAKTAGLGGFITPEEYRGITTLPEIPREVAFIGKGGLLALNGERKISVQSRGIDHLRYTFARVQTEQINHLVSQTGGSFESLYFRGRFGLANLSDYEHSIQTIVKKDAYGRNYTSLDFSPFVQATQPGAKPKRGLFYVTMEGVRPRTPEDGEAVKGSPDHDWIPLSPRSRASNRYRRTSGSTYPLGDKTGDRRFILVTDLGLIMKEAADGSRFVYVKSFEPEAPVKDVKISVLSKNGTVLKKVRSNANGRDELPSLRGLQREMTPVALIAQTGDDLAFIPWDRYDRMLENSRFSVGGVAYSEANALQASLFSRS